MSPVAHLVNRDFLNQRLEQLDLAGVDFQQDRFWGFLPKKELTRKELLAHLNHCSAKRLNLTARLPEGEAFRVETLEDLATLDLFCAGGEVDPASQAEALAFHSLERQGWRFFLKLQRVAIGSAFWPLFS